MAELEDAYEEGDLLPPFRCHYIEAPTILTDSQSSPPSESHDTITFPLSPQLSAHDSMNETATARVMQKALAMTVMQYSKIRVQVDGVLIAPLQIIDQTYLIFVISKSIQ